MVAILGLRRGQGWSILPFLHFILFGSKSRESEHEYNGALYP